MSKNAKILGFASHPITERNFSVLASDGRLIFVDVIAAVNDACDAWKATTRRLTGDKVCRPPYCLEDLLPSRFVKKANNFFTASAAGLQCYGAVVLQCYSATVLHYCCDMQINFARLVCQIEIIVKISYFEVNHLCYNLPLPLSSMNEAVTSGWLHVGIEPASAGKAKSNPLLGLKNLTSAALC